MKTPWTIDRVQAELPMVYVRVGRSVECARVTGRKEPYATVWTFAAGRLTFSAEYSWDAVVRSLNTRRPLRA